MKYIFSFIIVCFVSFSFTQTNAKISFENETFDFGELPEGPKVETEFKFTNTGTEPLIISRAKGSCGCTVPTWPKEPIAPGETGTIKVVYNTARRPGTFTKSVTLTTNATENTTVIKIRGKVVKEAEEDTMPVKEPLLMAPSN